AGAARPAHSALPAHAAGERPAWPQIVQVRCRPAVVGPTGGASNAHGPGMAWATGRDTGKAHMRGPARIGRGAFRRDAPGRPGTVSGAVQQHLLVCAP